MWHEGREVTILGRKDNPPLSDRSRSLMALASGMRSWMTWAPADLSWEQTARCQHKGRPMKEILLSGRSHRPMAPTGALPHLAAAKIQVQVADVAVVRQPLQHGPGKVPRATHQHGQRGLCPSQPHPTSLQSPRQHPPQIRPLGRLPSPSHT